MDRLSSEPSHSVSRYLVEPAGEIGAPSRISQPAQPSKSRATMSCLVTAASGPREDGGFTGDGYEGSMWAPSRLLDSAGLSMAVRFWPEKSAENVERLGAVLGPTFAIRDGSKMKTD